MEHGNKAHKDVKISPKTPRQDSTQTKFGGSSANTSECMAENESYDFRSGQKAVRKLVDKIFDQFAGNVDVVSSNCSSVSLKRKTSVYSYDKRLGYWKNYLAERKLTTEVICHETGKTPQDVLFNCDSMVDGREKQSVLRVLDYAERMNPLIVMNREQAKLKGYVDPCTCQEVLEVHETLPKAERERKKTVEIIGMPKITREEQLGKGTTPCCDRKSKWLKSDVLGKRIYEKREDIERVIEYYADIDNLQVVGKNYAQLNEIHHNPEIKFLLEESIKRISSDTSCDKELPKEQVHVEEEVPEYGVKVNDQIFKVKAKRSSKNVEVEMQFVCEPFENLVKKVLHVQNIGRKSLNFDWMARSYYLKHPDLLKPNDDEFIFDHSPFRLVGGETRDILVLFQPRKVDVVKTRWLLKVEPPLFCRRLDLVVVKMTGKCLPPPEYVAKLDEICRIVIGKSNMKTMRSLNSNLAKLAPSLPSSHCEVPCPYIRALNDCEVFEIENPGIKCERYHDLELLKDIYRRVKKPREPAWDLNLDTLKAMILRSDVPGDRALIFAEMSFIVDEMRGEPISLEVKLDNYDERERTRLVFVRGVIGTGIDEWEELTLKVEEAFLVPIVAQFSEETLEVQKAYMAEHAEINEEFIILQEDSVLRTVLPQVRRNKALRDALYVQTYNHLCGIVESIVNVIESTYDI